MVSKNVSVPLSDVTNFDPNYLRTGKTEWAKKNSPLLYFLFKKGLTGGSKYRLPINRNIRLQTFWCNEIMDT